MNSERLDQDMGDDDQADEIRAYQRNIEDPPEHLRIRDRENEADGRLGIGEELQQEWNRGDRATEARREDERPAEVAAVDIIDDADL
ncbi:hypothetical protein [Nocardia sp. XZ_19_385]|uniref:hypothetical protein n=1 Tax=Nocardia sp. XZ_19_385 TaxID=2769488 RepID=UPI00188E6487|nr:hypothetical protein [Nocardia sp. XZ_19_385]